MPLRKQRAVSAKEKTKRLKEVKGPIYFIKTEGKSPVGFIGKMKNFPPVWIEPNSQIVLIDWKKKIVRDATGKIIGKLPEKLKYDRYCPEAMK
jgi:hypothetical protein